VAHRIDTVEARSKLKARPYVLRFKNSSSTSRRFS